MIGPYLLAPNEQGLCIGMVFQKRLPITAANWKKNLQYKLHKPTAFFQARAKADSEQGPAKLAQNLCLSNTCFRLLSFCNTFSDW